MKSGNAGRALVTGGAGFLGPHLVRRLLAAGWTVLALDNLRNGRREHVAEFSPNRKYQFCHGDITDGGFITDATRSFEPDVVYHLAALHFIPYCIAHPAETITVNVLGTQRVLDALAHAHGVRRFVLASTADVYMISDRPHLETDPIGSTNIYGVTKIFCEQLLDLARARFQNVRFFAARLFNVVGRGETNPHIVPDIVAGLRDGRPLNLGNLAPKRDYVNAADVAEAFFRLANYEGGEQVFNIGTGVGSSVSDLVAICEEVLQRKIEVQVDPAKVRPVERENLVADISRARRELGWEPSVSLRETMQELMAKRMAAAKA